MQHLFNTVKPEFLTRIKFNELFPHCDIVELIHGETQFFNATPSFIRTYADSAPITWKVLNRYFRQMLTDDEFHHTLINTYCHHLPHPGMHASIPGWHCDYSTQTDEAQRTSLEEDADTKHWVLIMGTETPPTYDFIDHRSISLDDDKLTEKTWPNVSHYIDRKVKSGWPIKPAKPFEILEFRGNELYRTQPSTNDCWRMQIKVSLYPKGHKYRPSGSHGKIRELTMVYVDSQNGY